MKYFCKNCQSYQERDKKKCCLECGSNLKEASLAPSTVVAGFKIIKEIGRGSNGIVYLAEQTSLDRKVALKILPDIKAEDENFVKDFLKEARAAARLNYPSIIQVYDAGVTNDGIYFLAMELIDGNSLEETLQSKGALKPKNAIKIMLKIAKALEYSWERERLFHGDIKPDNIMISKDGKTKLADFGLAKTIFDEKSEEIMATPMYAPPEVIRAEHENIGFRSDMYSFGITLYEILHGKPPFNEADCQKVLYMHLQKYHTPLIEKMPEIDKSISDLIDKLLSKNIKKRPENWTEVIKTLQALQTEKTSSKLTFYLITGISLAVIITGMAIAGLLYYRAQKGPPKIVKKLVIIKPKVEKKATKKVNPKAKNPVVKVKKDEKSHLKFINILKNAENLKSILDASRLKNQAVTLQKNNSLSKKESLKLAACIAKINNYIQETRKDINEKELSKLNSALKNEEKIRKKLLDNISEKSSLTARENNFFKLTTKFLTYKRAKQTVKTLQNLLNMDSNLDKKAKEYKALTFLLEVLPHKYNREAAIFENLDQLTGKKLPWEIKDKEYSITGGSWQSMHLKTQFSKGVFSRKKIRATSISNSHWCLMVNEFLIKGNIKTTRKNITNTACWLLLYANNELFTDFIKKYYPEDSTVWFNCRKLLTDAPEEIAAYNEWLNIVKQMTELNPKAYNDINDFKNKYGKTKVYQNAQIALVNYQKILCAIYPDAFINRLHIKSLSLKSSNSKIFVAQNRYRLLQSISFSKRLLLKNIFYKKLKSLAGDKQFTGQFGIFTDVPCGKVYSWMTTASRPPSASMLRYTPALIDIDNWNHIKRLYQDTSNLKTALSELKGNPEQYPFSLYCNGLVALQYGKWEILDKIFSDYNKLLLQDDIDSTLCHSLFADLALKTRGDQYAWEVLNKYKFEEAVKTDEIIIPLLKIQALLTQNPVNETAVTKIITDTRKHFAKHSDLSADLEVLNLLRQFICAEFKPSTSVKTDLFRNTAYPHLHARLWLEAAARDKILQRNSIKVPALIKASHSILTPSAFRSDLFRKITSLELGYKISTPSQLRNNLEKILLELKPHATNLYPSLLTLLFASELLDNKLAARKLAPFAKAYMIECPIFSPVEKQFYNVLYNPDPLKVLNNCQKFSPITFQKIYLWILAAAKAKQSGNAEEYILQLKLFRKELRWTEQLLLNRFIQLIENTP